MTQAVEKGRGNRHGRPNFSRKSHRNTLPVAVLFLNIGRWVLVGPVEEFRVQVMPTEKGLPEPTGWHYHVCEGQFVFMLSGWVDLVFEKVMKSESVRVIRSIFPGGLRHNETATSDPF
ncbi:MAG: hypothetical protein CM1200mP18_15180 [Gammaproteobacteria bacterium]|nr:MAG: hypothetical protein CM1200mP18_15180 [Gammaproteobacteria bacterium]